MSNVTIEISPIAKKVIDSLKATISNSPTGVSFIAINGYKNKQGEVSNNVVNVGMEYKKQVAKDIEKLKAFDILSVETKSSKVMLEKARTELINNFNKPNKKQSEAQKNAYTHITNGLKVHNESGEVYIYAYSVNKKVVVKGEYKKSNPRELTIAKNELKKLADLTTDKFRTYIVEEIDSLTMSGKEMTI